MILLAAAALAIPAQYHGLWAEDVSLCPPIVSRGGPGNSRYPIRAEGLVAVRADGIDFFASTTRPVEQQGRQEDFTFRALTQEEGEFVDEEIGLRRGGNNLSIRRDDEVQVYVLCPLQPD